MDLNGVMSIIANVPAAIASTVSHAPLVVFYPPIKHTDRRLPRCPSPRKLLPFQSGAVWVRSKHIHNMLYLYGVDSPATQASTLAFHSGNAVIASKPGAPLAGVHVQMETFQSMDRSFEGLPSPIVDEQKLRDMDSEKASENGTCDLEAQVIREDFKTPPY